MIQSNLNLGEPPVFFQVIFPQIDPDHSVSPSFLWFFQSHILSSAHYVIVFILLNWNFCCGKRRSGKRSFPPLRNQIYSSRETVLGLFLYCYLFWLINVALSLLCTRTVRLLQHGGWLLGLWIAKKQERVWEVIKENISTLSLSKHKVSLGRVNSSATLWCRMRTVSEPSDPFLPLLQCSNIITWHLGSNLPKFLNKVAVGKCLIP